MYSTVQSSAVRHCSVNSAVKHSVYNVQCSAVQCSLRLTAPHHCSPFPEILKHHFKLCWQSKINAKINLKFDKFQTFACKVQQKMRNSDFCYVTLVCADNMKFDAHKVIISAYSPVFKNMLTSEKHRHPLVFMTGVGQEVAGAVLNFMYCGEAKINLFIKLSMDLELSGVTAESFSEKNYE